MDNHLSSSGFLFENTNGSIYPNDLVLSIIEDASSSPPNTNGSLSSSPSNQSLDISTTTTTEMTFPCCIFYCKPNSHPFQERCIPFNEQVKIGRAVARLKALSNNAIFDCKVLSRQHAKIWYEDGKFFLQDTKSSNGTFVNNQRLGKCNEESEPCEIYSGDSIQFGVDVTENNRKTTHNCIIMEVKLFHIDGNEALSRSANNQSLAQIHDLDVNTQTLYQLAQYLQEAMHREQMLEQKLEYLQGVLRDTQQASNESFQAIIHEDRLLGRINVLEDQIRIYRTKHMNEDTIKQELSQLTDSHMKFEEESKIKLEKILIERTDAINRSKTCQSSLQIAQEELKHCEEQYEQYKQDIQQYVQSIDEQRSLISDFVTKLQETQTRCTEFENEKQRIQTEFDEYYQRTHHLENGTNHGRFQVQSPSKDPIAENGENEIHPPTMAIVNHNHKEEEEEDDNNIDEQSSNGIDSINILTETQKQLVSIREDLTDTNERLVSTEDSYRIEQERYRSLTSEYELITEQLSQLKHRVNKEKTANNDLVEEQQNELVHLSKSILSKQTEHDQLLSVYICFFSFLLFDHFFSFLFSSTMVTFQAKCLSIMFRKQTEKYVWIVQIKFLFVLISLLYQSLNGLDLRKH